MRLACLSVFVLLITSFCAAQSPRPLGPAPTVWLSQESTSTVNNSIGVDTGGIYWDDLFGSKTYFKNLATSAAVAAGYLPLTAGAGAALTGILAANEGVSVDGTTRISGTGVGSLAAGSTVNAKPIAVTTADNDFSTTQTQYGLAVEGPGGGLVLKINTGEIRIDKSVEGPDNEDPDWDAADTQLSITNAGTITDNLNPEDPSIQHAVTRLYVDGPVVSGLNASATRTAASPPAGAIGPGSTATGENALAVSGGTASGGAAVALGGTASGTSSLSVGGGSTASGAYSTAIGESTASGIYSMAWGQGSQAIGRYSTAGGLRSYASGYAAHVISDYTTATAFTAGAIGGGHNRIWAKGALIDGIPGTGIDGADSFIGGCAYTEIWALRAASVASFEGRINGDYSLGIGNKPLISDAHDGALVVKGTQGNSTTDTTGPNQALFYPDAPASGGQMAVKGQPLTTATLTVWGPAAVAGTISTTGTVQTKGAAWRDLPGIYGGTVSATDGWVVNTERMNVANNATDGVIIHYPIVERAGTVISRVRARWENFDAGGSSGVILRIVKLSATDTGGSEESPSVVVASSDYTSASAGINVSTWDLADQTLADGEVYAIQVESQTPAGDNVYLYSVGYETTTRVY